MLLTDLSPMQRHVLLQIHQAPGQALVRAAGGFRAHRTATDVVTVRTANGMQVRGLVTFDQTPFPTRITLTAEGRRLAEQRARIQHQREVAACPR